MPFSLSLSPSLRMLSKYIVWLNGFSESSGEAESGGGGEPAMTRRCSHCSNNGHNSRTCPSRGGGGNCVKLFGVRLTDGSIIKKSASMGNLSAHYHSSSSAAASPNPSSPSSDPIRDPILVPDGYLSDDPAHATCSTNRRLERKKGNSIRFGSNLSHIIRFVH